MAERVEAEILGFLDDISGQEAIGGTVRIGPRTDWAVLSSRGDSGL